MKVTIWTYPGFWEQARARSGPSAREAGLPGEHQASRGPRRLHGARWTTRETRGVQAGMIGWYGVPRTASSLLTGFRCTPPDLSFFCDGRVDAEIARALETRGHRPGRRARAVGEDRARHRRPRARVPLFTPSHVQHRLQARRQLPVQPRVGDPVRSALGAIEPLSAVLAVLVTHARRPTPCSPSPGGRLAEPQRQPRSAST